SITLGTYSSGWIDQGGVLGCRQGIWDLSVGGSMTMYITNTTSVSAGAYKYVLVQVTQYRDSIIYTANAGVSVSGGSLVSQQQQTIETTGFGAQWVVEQTVWRLPSVPAYERVVLTAGANGSLIDQVVVDTIALDPTCPSDIVANANAGQCSKSNV